jgi:hypothetical protein
MNRLGKWRVLFSGWQLGTRPKGDPECDAVRDFQEARLIQRAELTAITSLLLSKGVCTEDELREAMADEADALNAQLEKRFPGVVATDIGLQMDKRVLPWMKGWKP